MEGRHRSTSDFCHQHGTVVQGSPFRVQLSVVAFPAAPLLMARDFAEFVSLSALTHEDFAVLILAVAIKEPLAAGRSWRLGRSCPPTMQGTSCARRS